MADRRVVVRLTGEVAQFQAAMAAAGTSTKAMAKTCETAGIRVKQSMAGVAGAAAATETKVAGSMARMKTSMKQGFMSGAGVGVMAGIFGGAAIGKVVLDFEVAMSKVSAVAGATTGELARLREMALKMGSSTKFSATEVAGGMEEMAKAGIATKDIFTSLPSVLTLAAAGDLEVGRAAGIAAITMTQFEMSAKDLPAIVDRLAKGAAASTADVDSLSTALAYVGPMAHAMKIGMDETINTLSLFASAGLDADMAGTNMRGILQSMVSPSMMARKAMEEYNIVLHDGKGNFLGFKNLAEQLSSKLGHLSDKERDLTLGRILSNAQISGGNILMREGAKGLDEWAAKVDSATSATEQARRKLDNLTSDLKKLGGALKSDLIKAAENATPTLRSMTQGATDAVKGFGDLSGAMQLTIVGLIASRLMAGRFGNAMTSSAGKVGSFTSSLREASSLQVAATKATATYARTQTALGRNLDAVTGKTRTQNLALHTTAAQAGAAARGVDGFAGVLGRSHGQFVASTSSAGRFSAVLRGVGGSAGIAGRGLMGAMGGPWGLALSAAVVGLGYLADAHGKAKIAEDMHKQGVQDLSMALRESSGVITENVRAVAFKALQDQGLIENARTLGISVKDLTDAYLGDEAAMLRVQSATKGARGEFREMQKDAEWPWGKDAAAQDKFFESLGKMEGALPRVGRAAGDAKQSNDEYSDAVTRGADATNGQAAAADQGAAALTNMGAAGEGAAAGITAAGQAAATVESTITALKSSLDSVLAGFNAVADAESAFRSEDSKGVFEKEGTTKHPGSKGREWVPGKGDTRKPTTTVTEGKDKTTTVTVTPTKTGSITKTRVVTRHPGTKGDVTYDEAGNPVGGGMVGGKADTVSETTKVKTGGVPVSRGHWKEKNTPGGPDTKYTIKIRPQIDWLTGKFSLDTEEGRAQHDWMSGKSKKLADVFVASYTEAMKGVDLKDADAVNAAGMAALGDHQKLRDAWIADISAVTGMSHAAAESIVDEYHPIPDVLAKMANAPAMAKLLTDLRRAGGAITRLDGKKIGITVSTLGAANKLKALGGQVKRMPNGKFLITFPNAKAAMSAVNAIARPKSGPRKAPIKVELSPKELAEAHKKLRNLSTPIVVPVGTKYVGDLAGKAAHDFHGVIDEHRATGGVDAHVAGSPNVLYGERSTGGEAFIPRFGDRAKAAKTMATVAGWYGMNTQPAASPNVNVQARVFVGNREITDIVRVEVDTHGRNTALQSAYGRRT